MEPQPITLQRKLIIKEREKGKKRAKKYKYLYVKYK